MQVWGDTSRIYALGGTFIYFNVTGTTHIFLFGLINKYPFETYYFTSFRKLYVRELLSNITNLHLLYIIAQIVRIQFE
jgi:hypothetical protein